MAEEATNWMPTKKVTAATIGCAAGGLLIWAAQAFGGVAIPTEQGSMVQLITTALAGYWIKEG